MVLFSAVEAVKSLGATEFCERYDPEFSGIKYSLLTNFEKKKAIVALTIYLENNV